MDTAWHIQGQPKNLKEWQSQLRRLEVNGAKNMTETVEIKKGKAGRLDSMHYTIKTATIIQ